MKISYKWASYTLGTLFLIFGIFIFVETLSFPEIPGTVMGSEYLPRILSTLMVLTAILSIILTALKKQDQHFEIKYPLFLLIYIGLVILFTILIKYFNYYFVLLGFFIVCFGVLNREKPRRKAWIKSVLVALLMTAVVYLTIGRILGVFI
jgi:hypothetical protein